ncbi:MAG: alpha/beta hydrolase [Methyloceanibacter sp.]|nr:alpha/beta hydrolase [Methyloceanibacter sp.]
MPVLRRCKSLWIHGAGLSGRTWQSLRTDLPHSAAPDLPGHGHASATMPPRVEHYADKLLPWLEEGTVLIGHSLGGMVALEMAARSPVPLGALIIVEGVATVKDSWMGRVGPCLVRPLLKRLPADVLARLSGFGQSRAAADETLRLLSLMRQDQIVDAFDAARFYDGRPHLAGLRVPTLVIVGTDNRATHRGARLVAEGIAGAEFEILRGGHMLHIDNPEGLRRTIEAFLKRKRISTLSVHAA